jgi:hypothetical protein
VGLFLVKQYRSEDYEVWNRFVSQAKNATFLFHRDFMEYHSDRFEDYSLLVFNDKKKVVAILPANRVGASVFSHQGLTYGGIVWSQKNKLLNALPIYQSILKYLHEKGIVTIQFNLIPNFYCSDFSNELDYLLFVSEGKWKQSQSFSVVDLTKRLQFSETRNQLIKKRSIPEFEIKKEENLSVFWNELLLPTLIHTFNSKPTHSLEEITTLKKIFPNNIQQYSIYKQDKIIAGTTLFITENVAHTQYIATLKEEEFKGAIDYLFSYLMKEVYNEKRFFDFGSSNENSGKIINKGLLFWKESFGAQTVIQNFYEVETANFELLNSVLK